MHEVILHIPAHILHLAVIWLKSEFSELGFYLSFLRTELGFINSSSKGTSKWQSQLLCSLAQSNEKG